MTAKTYLEEPTADIDGLRSLFGPIFEKVGEANRTREKDCVLPREQVGWLNDAGFGTVRIPRAHGGLGASLEQTLGRELIDDGLCDVKCGSRDGQSAQTGAERTVG